MIKAMLDRSMSEPSDLDSLMEAAHRRLIQTSVSIAEVAALVERSKEVVERAQKRLTSIQAWVPTKRDG